MSKLLTVSRLRAYRRCARYERLSYVDGWRPVRDSEALHFGTLVHAGLEAWWTAHRHNAPELAREAAMAAVVGKAADPFTQVKVEELLRGYDARWADQRCEIDGVEDQFSAPLLNPQTMRRSKVWTLAGKIDARATIDGRRLIVEHKTTSEDISPAADYWIKLQMDHQLSIYTLGAEALGWPPDGCLYDVLKKPALRPLEANSRRAAPETPDEFRARLRAAIDEEPERWFQRREIPRMESQLIEFLDDAWNQGASMAADHKAGRAPRNPEACHLFGRCPYWAVCSVGLRPEEHPDLFRRVEHVHPELAEDAAA